MPIESITSPNPLTASVKQMFSLLFSAVKKTGVMENNLPKVTSQW